MWKLQTVHEACRCFHCIKVNAHALKPWPNYRTKLDSTFQLCSIQHCSTVWPPMLHDSSNIFCLIKCWIEFAFDQKNFVQQFCSTNKCCSVLPLFQQNCFLKRVTSAIIGNHESLSALAIVVSSLGFSRHLQYIWRKRSCLWSLTSSQKIETRR